jgi:ribosomal-protein-alanine N-acetyltransferase
MTQSSNIRLVAHTPDHLRALLAGGNAYELQFHLSVARGVRESLCGPEVSEAFLERVREAEAADFWRDGFGIVHFNENRVIGLCSFNGPPEADGSVEISYFIAPDYTGLGYATEAARLLIDCAFANPLVQSVRAHTLPEHNASTRILQKCRFKYCGELIDAVDGAVWRWELQREDSPCQPATPSSPS